MDWVVISFSRGSSQHRNWTLISCIGRCILYHWATRETLSWSLLPFISELGRILNSCLLFSHFSWTWFRLFGPTSPLKQLLLGLGTTILPSPPVGSLWLGLPWLSWITLPWWPWDTTQLVVLLSWRLLSLASLLVPSHLLDAATATAKSLQSCPTLCDPRDSSPPGSPVPGILQARTLEWVAISFSNAGKWKVKVKSLSRV